MKSRIFYNNYNKKNTLRIRIVNYFDDRAKNYLIFFFNEPAIKYYKNIHHYYYMLNYKKTFIY